VKTAALPTAHNPSGCPRYEHYEAILEGLPVIGWKDHFEREQEAARLWIESMAPEDFAACETHQADWKRIADAAVAAVRRYGSHPTDDELEGEFHRFHLSEADADWGATLFFDPISVRHGMYESGQHRACAIRAAGADELVIAV